MVAVFKVCQLELCGRILEEPSRVYCNKQCRRVAKNIRESERKREKRKKKPKPEYIASGVTTGAVSKTIDTTYLNKYIARFDPTHIKHRGKVIELETYLEEKTVKKVEKKLNIDLI